jgi:hypothetical protein
VRRLLPRWSWTSRSRLAQFPLAPVTIVLTAVPFAPIAIAFVQFPLARFPLAPIIFAVTAVPFALISGGHEGRASARVALSLWAAGRPVGCARRSGTPGRGGSVVTTPSAGSLAGRCLVD